MNKIHFYSFLGLACLPLKVTAKPIIIDFNDSKVSMNSIVETKTESKIPSNENPRSLSNIINEHAERNQISPALIKAVIQTESGYNGNALSSKGAIGLMQVLPSTANMYGSYNLYEVNDNITVGTKHLAYLIKKYKYLPYALAAYNAGEGNVDKYNGIPPFAETQSYVLKVLKSYNRELDLATQVKQPVKEIPLTDSKVVADQPPKALIKTKATAAPKVIFINL